MKRNLMDILRCPKCKGELELKVTLEEKEIEEGVLICYNCEKDYPIEKGIPNMLA